MLNEFQIKKEKSASKVHIPKIVGSTKTDSRESQCFSKKKTHEPGRYVPT